MEPKKVALKKYPPKGFDYVLRFGKHQGETILEVLKSTPDYLWWCIDNVDGFELENEAYEKLCQTLSYDTYQYQASLKRKGK